MVCIRDLDLWPRRAEQQGVDDKIGFKTAIPRNAQGKGGNESNWIDSYDAPELTVYTDGLKKIAGQNVVVELSDAWTFEYSLAAGALWKAVYEAINGDTAGSETLPSDAEERAIAIYGMIETQSGAKTEVAYKLVQLLRTNIARSMNSPREKRRLNKRKSGSKGMLSGGSPFRLSSARAFPAISCDQLTMSRARQRR